MYRKQKDESGFMKSSAEKYEHFFLCDINLYKDLKK